MNYFNYALDCTPDKALRVYSVVWGLKSYARSIYRDLWEDALDMSFFHIIKNFNEESGGDLEHYATKVVGKILLNKYAHEIEHETSLQIELDNKSVEEGALAEVQPSISSTNVKDCVNYLFPMFILDWVFFKTQKPEFRKLSYEGLFEKFSESTVAKSMKYLVSKYNDELEELYNLRKECHYRNFPEDRYKSDLDETVEYISTFNGVVLLKQISGTKSKKNYYDIDLVGTINDIITELYTNENGYARKIGSCMVYCTLSGRLVLTKEELLKALETELVGAILARNRVKVVAYEKGKSLLISSSKELDDVYLTIKDLDFSIRKKRMIAKIC